MRAAFYTHNGPASEVLQVGDVETPKAGPGEVLVRVAFSGVNPSDVKSRAGRPLNGDYQIPHSDGSGVIEAVGEGIPAARIGERVWTWNGAWQRQNGTCAELVCLPAAQAVRLSDSVSLEAGACLGIPGLTAYRAWRMVEEAGARSVLVTGAASSVGFLASQMAVQSGMQVIGTASARRRDHALAAGCNAVIDYRSENIVERIADLSGGKGVDAIIDMDFSSGTQLLASTALRPHGLYVCYGSNAMGEIAVPFRDLLFRSISLQFFLVYELTREQREEAVEGLGRMLAAGKLTIPVAPAYALSDIVKAHQAVEAGETLSNVVVSID
ncbi:MAG: NADPH:quinone reductase [Rhizobiaceae bacterium]